MQTVKAILQSLQDDCSELRGQAHRLRQSAVMLLESGGGSKDPAVYRCSSVSFSSSCRMPVLKISYELFYIHPGSGASVKSNIAGSFYGFQFCQCRLSEFS